MIGLLSPKALLKPLSRRVDVHFVVTQACATPCGKVRIQCPVILSLRDNMQSARFVSNGIEMIFVERSSTLEEREAHQRPINGPC